MVYRSPETLKAARQVVEISSVKSEDGAFVVDYRVTHPFTGESHGFSLKVPRDVEPSDSVWAGATSAFAEMFPRSELMLVYRDVLRTMVIEEVFKRTKKAKPKLDKEALRAKAAAAKAKAKPADGDTGMPRAEQPAAPSGKADVEKVKELIAKAKEFEAKATDAMLDGADRKKAEMRARAFRTKAEKAAKDAGINIEELG
jgi:hypothetical protein